jgi:N-acetylglucosamine kinase-like BadF-type ATPase
MSGSTPGKERLVLGLDIGGTWTRALLATTAARRVGSGRSAGANPSAHGVSVAAGRIAAALDEALRGSDPGAVEGCVVGLAGASQYASDPAIAQAFEEIWRAAGLTCRVRVTSDVAVAFAAGTPRPAGSVLLAGTGAVAAEVRDREPVAIHGGYGWLLGDDGSAFWIGRQAVRAVLSAMDGRAPTSPLSRLIHAWYFGDGDGHGTDFSGRNGAATSGAATSGPPAQRRPPRRPIADLIREVNRRPAISLADLAPLVMRARAAGDATAELIVREAAELLVATFGQSRAAGSDTPIVLAGGLLVSATPVRDLVVPALRDRWPGADLCTALDGPAAAAWLAALPLLDGQAEAEALHAGLMPPETRRVDAAPPGTLV